MRTAVIALVVLLSAALAAAPPEFAPQEPDARPVSFLSDTKAVLNFRTAGAVPTRIQMRIGTLPASTPGQEKAWTDVETIDVDPEPKLVHCVTLHGLKPATRYYYRWFDPSAPKSDPPDAWSAAPPWTREYAFATLAAKGETSFLRIPIKVLLVPNVINLDTVTADTPQPEPMSDSELNLYKESFAQNTLFYWVNSRMRYLLDCEFFVEPEWCRVGREGKDLGDFWAKLRPARDGLRVFDPNDIGNHEAKPPLKDKRIWTGQVIVVCERHWDKDRQRWYYQGSGGGTFGIDWMLWGDETQRPAPGRSTWLGGSDQAWLMCHEYHHQKESQYAISGLTRENDRVVFDHFAIPYRSPWDENGSCTAFNHGEHWDGIAWELRMLTDAQYMRNIFGEITTAKDSDGDGIPDADPRLPLDEKRLGSDPQKASTDGALGDMQKVMLAKWVPTNNTDLRVRRMNPGYQQLWSIATGGAAKAAGGLGYRWPELTKTDSDGDGVPDSKDPAPIYPWNPIIGPAEITVDGDLADWAKVPPIGELKTQASADQPALQCTLKTAHDDKNLYYAVELVGDYASVMFNIDGDADGWYVGNDNLQVVIGQPETKDKDPKTGRPIPDQSAAPVLRQTVAHICSNRWWPYFDDGGPQKWTDPKTKKEYTFARPKLFGGNDDVVMKSKVDGNRKTIELSLPNGTGKLPIQAAQNHPVGLAFYIRLANGGQLSMYEPYTLFRTTWERSATPE
jgi:hypothetical protein